jgi:hypothetical protein
VGSLSDSFPSFPSPGRQGFILRTVTRLHRPCFLGTTRESATLCTLLPSGSPSRFGFMKSLAPFGFQCRRASLGKMHQPPCIPSHFTAVRFTGYQASLSHDGLTSSPRPSSRFAVRYVHRFCLMLPPDSPSLEMPLPCRRCPSVRLRWIFYFQVYSWKVGQCFMPGARQNHRQSRWLVEGPSKGPRSTLILTPSALYQAFLDYGYTLVLHSHHNQRYSHNIPGPKNVFR